MLKQIVKTIVKVIIPRKVIAQVRQYRKISKKYPKMSVFEILRRGSILCANKELNYMDEYVRQFSKIVRKIMISDDYGYIYPYDPFVERELLCTPIASITVDFKTVLESNLLDLKGKIQKCNDVSFSKREESIIRSIEYLANKIFEQLQHKTSKRYQELSSYFPDMLYHTPESLDEALQKILFYDALFWQMRHSHIGLGRLDTILYDYYVNDINKGALTRAQAREKLRNFILVLGKDTVSKSLELIGDTGQYILLGGIDKKGTNVDNELTELFIDILAELRIPDPKIILRVNEHTSDNIWSKAINCINTGIGSPLIMNENIIMDKMKKYGYNAEDVWNVGTSACWEPLIIGKSFDQNNPFRSAIALKPLNSLILEGKQCTSFTELYNSYKQEYKKELAAVVKDIRFDCSPLFTLFFDDCLEREKDFTDGGAIYAYHGVQVVSLPNTVNALLNIKRLVFDEHLIGMDDCRNAINSNFVNMEDLRTLLITTGKKFGSTDAEVIDITNDMISFTADVVRELKCNGEHVKVGFSSPNYISQSKNIEASLDGRKNGEPFAVHISPISSQIDISEILDFSSHLKYEDNCINGNVVDFILPSSYIKNPDKLRGVLKSACSKGLYELQLNVMDKATLIDAKAHPDKYPHLVVRVWGFSAYFNDLPEEYKDNLIRRADTYEAA